MSTGGRQRLTITVIATAKGGEAAAFGLSCSSAFPVGFSSCLWPHAPQELFPEGAKAARLDNGASARQRVSLSRALLIRVPQLEEGQWILVPLSPNFGSQAGGKVRSHLGH